MATLENLSEGCPDPFEGKLDQIFNDDFWKEAAANSNPGGGDNFSGDGGGEATIAVTKIPFNRLASFYRYCVGWQGCSLGGSLILQRSLPKRHPLYQELAAANVHGLPFRLDARPIPLDPDTGEPVPSPLVGLKRVVVGNNIGNTPPAFTGYKWAKGTIGFTDLNYELITDTVMGTAPYTWIKSGTDPNGCPDYQFPAEWLRFTELDPAPRVEVLSLDGFTMTYADGSGNTAPTSNPKGLQTPAPVGQLLVKADLALTTYKLPQEFLFGPGEVFPRNILMGLGTVNRYAIFGRAPGTLLFTGVELTKRRFSLRVPDGFATWNETRFLWKAKFLFSFFDPPTGLNSNETYTTTNLRGHNCLFWIGGRNTTTGAFNPGDKNSMKWFWATSTGNPNDPALLPNFDHAQLWRPVCNTAAVMGGGANWNPCYFYGPNQHIPN